MIKENERYLRRRLWEITENSLPLKKLGKYVYGKKVYIPKGKRTETYDLETWVVSLPFTESTDLTTLMVCLKEMIKQKEKGNIPYEELHKYTCHQLCDWFFLQNDEGGIIRNGKVTLVKYAIILKDKEGVDYGEHV
jgi:hypothetical protein